MRSATGVTASLGAAGARSRSGGHGGAAGCGSGGTGTAAQPRSGCAWGLRSRPLRACRRAGDGATLAMVAPGGRAPRPVTAAPARRTRPPAAAARRGAAEPGCGHHGMTPCASQAMPPVQAGPRPTRHHTPPWRAPRPLHRATRTASLCDATFARRGSRRHPTRHPAPLRSPNARSKSACKDWSRSRTAPAHHRRMAGSLRRPWRGDHGAPVRTGGEGQRRGPKPLLRRGRCLLGAPPAPWQRCVALRRAWGRRGWRSRPQPAASRACGRYHRR